MASLVVRSAGSGEVLAQLDADDFQRMVETHGNTAKALKLELKDQGFGCRFRLRLLNDSAEIPDEEILVPPLDLELVRLNLCPFDEADTVALVEASKEGRLEEVETRLKKPQDPNAANEEGRTALQWACFGGHTEVVRLLLEAGSACDQTHHGQASLHVAACKGRVEVVRLLLAAGASCDLALAGSGTALHLAAGRGHTEVVRLLLDAGASCDVATDSGVSPLHRAVAHGHVEVVRLLLEAGTRHVTTELIGVAADKGHVEICHLLEAGAQERSLEKTQQDDGLSAKEQFH